MAKLKSFFEKPFHNKLNSLYGHWGRIFGVLYYRQIFASFGARTALFPPTHISNPQCIHIGKDTLIRQGVRLEAVIATPGDRPEIRIGDNVNIEQNVHIVCNHRVIMGDNVSIAPFCAILDTGHVFGGIGDAKPGNLISDDKATVDIGEGTWIGMGTSIFYNVRIGKRCAIGANSVVTKDIPDGSIAAGSPDRVIRSI